MEYFKLNQTVYHPIYGEGKVIDINLSMNYPILVKFQEDNYTFTIDGKNDVTSSKITLSQNPIPEIVNKSLEDTYIPFTFQDRELLRGKWIKQKDNPIWETMIIFINNTNIGVDNGMYYSYEELLKTMEFIDGTPCGKKV